MRWSFLMTAVCLAGCSATPPVVAPVTTAVSRTDAVASECRLLEQAYELTRAAQGRAPQDILTGCPGHPEARDEMPLSAQSAALRRAGVVQIPAAVRATGVQGPRIYRRMITRGVPEPVAQQLAGSELMAAAAQR